MNELAKSLTQTYEGLSGSANDKLKVVDPVVETPMVLNIEQIELYENNPRTFKNPKYDDIKASINAEGLKQPLCVTRRPGDSKYFVEAGGNTRLSILWELFEETSDYKYANISVIFRPWKDDSNIMVSHLIENELRGEMCFVDTAKAICDLKASLDSELNKSLSWRKFEDVLVERGLPYSHAQVSRMRFLVEQLLPLLPDELLATFGSHHTQIIQSAISEAKKHYTGDLEFIEYYECSIKSWFKLFDSVDAVANSIVSLVQSEPNESVASEDEESANDEDKNQEKDNFEPNALNDKGVTEKAVVQAEPARNEKSEALNTDLARLQAIIRLRAENYDLACILLHASCVGPSDEGIGFLIDSNCVKKSVHHIFRSITPLLNADAYSVNLYKINELEINIQKTIMKIVNNTHQMLMNCKMLGVFVNHISLDALNNGLILRLQSELDHVE